MSSLSICRVRSARLRCGGFAVSSFGSHLDLVHVGLKPFRTVRVNTTLPEIALPLADECD